MTVALRAVTTPVGGNTATISVGKPAGVVDGDMMLMGIYANLNVNPSPPAGWTLVDQETNGTFNISVYKKIASGEGANYTVTQASTESYAAGIVAFYSTTPLTLFIDASADLANASSTDRTAPGVTTTKASAGLACFLNLASNFSSTPPGDMAEQWDALTGSNRCYGMTRILSSAGATGDKVATGASASTSRAVTVAVAELAPPTAPSGLTATATGTDRIALAWTDNSSNETGFEIDRSPTGAGSWTLIHTTAANAISYTNTGLAEHTTYYYRVRAVNADGGSAYASTASAATLGPRLPQRLHLFLLDPAVAFSARVNLASATYPIDTIPFDGVIDGAFGDVRVGMTVLFGSTLYGDDLGRQRVRAAATSNTLYIGRSSRGVRDGEVTATDNAYITVLDDFRVWAKIPYIADDGTINKDSDLAFTDQTEDSPPVANTGPGFAATINSITGLITVALSGSASFATADGATISAYAWDIQDGTVTAGAANTASVTLTFPAGFRWIALTVTDSNGKTHTAWMPIFARDPDDDGAADGACTYFQVESHRITQQGQTLSVRVRQDISAATYPDGTLVMMWLGEPESASDRNHMQFVGWHQTDPAGVEASRTATLGDTTLNCVDVAGKLDTLPGFPQVLESDATPANWSEMVAPNINKYLHYLLHWHSTALDVADWTWATGGASYVFTILGSDGESLYDQVNRRAGSIVPDHLLTCNRRGQLAVKVDPLLQDTADRTATIQVTLTEADWSDIRYTHQRPPRVHWLRGSAIIAHASTLSTAFAIAPGTSPGQGETSSEQGEQLALTQAALNAATGHRYARLNAPQGIFNITLADGDDFDIDPAAMTWVRMNLSAGNAAQRGLVLTNARGLPKELSIRYDANRTGLIRTMDLQWERETTGEAAVTVEIEPAEPVDDGDNWWIPPTDPTNDPVNEGLYDGVDNIIIVSDAGDTYKTANFQNASPTWASVALDHNGHNVFSFVVDPFSPLYRGLGSTVNGWIATTHEIIRVVDLFGTPVSTIQHTFADSVAYDNKHWRQIGASFGRYESVEADNPWLICVSHYRDTAGHLGTWAMYSQDAGATWSAEAQLSAHYDSTIGATAWQIPVGLYLSPKTPGLAYSAAYTSTADPATADGYVTTDWGGSWAAMSSPDIQPGARTAGTIHVPWPGNDDELLAYYGHFNDTNPHQFRTKRVQGGTITDISPNDGSRSYGPYYGQFGIVTYDSDRRYVAQAGLGNDVNTTTADTKYRVYTSSDYGDTWTSRESITNTTDPHCEHLAFAGDNPLCLYLWGYKLYIKYTEDSGATLEDKTGNLTVVSGGSNARIVGLAGGDALP